MRGLDLDPSRPAASPRDAATLVLVRPHGDGRGGDGVEVFCVERNKQSRFLGGAVVFPGGKLDPEDLDDAWAAVTTAPIDPAPARSPIAADARALRGLGVAACREALEEAAILPVTGGALAHEELLELRAKVAAGEVDLRSFLADRGLALDLAALRPFARWVTPVAESRRYDARFFLVAAPPGQRGAHDELETMESFWATPRDLLERFDAGKVQLAPPTHRTIELLGARRTVEEALAAADEACLDVVCPELVLLGDAPALVLPGDPEHSVKEARVPGASRFVLRDGRFVPENPR